MERYEQRDPPNALKNQAESSRMEGHEKAEWCPEADLNHRHADFQSAALPTELSGHPGRYQGYRKGRLVPPRKRAGL